jgi:hypothetical protein
MVGTNRTYDLLWDRDVAPSPSPDAKRIHQQRGDSGVLVPVARWETCMDNFSVQLQSWQVFYATVGAASATLSGLLFVSLSLNRERLKDATSSGPLATARRSFANFLYVLMLSLAFLVPHPAPIGLAVALVVLGLSRAIGLVHEVARWRGQLGRSGRPGELLRDVALPVVASVGLVAVGIAVATGQTIALFGLVLVVAGLLVSATWNAWMLLVQE